MSLEANLELNNQLLTQQNELQTRNIALLERLVSTLASGVALRPDTVAQVQEYRETVADTGGAAPTLDDLKFSDVIALAAFYPEPQVISLTMLQRAIDYRDAEGEKRVVQIDALDSALQGVKRAKELNKPALLDLSRYILRHWDELPTIADRRSFAERLLDAKAGERDTVTPKKPTGKGNQQERKGPFYWKDVKEGLQGCEDTLEELQHYIECGAEEINKVEYLQLKEAVDKTSTKPDTDQPDFVALREEAKDLILKLAKGGYREEAKTILGNFGGTKLGEVADENLADVIAQAEKALEG
jgi:hypothetical protein